MRISDWSSDVCSSDLKFVPLAEEARLIAPIGEWVLRTACDEAARWPPDVRIAVNVSAEQLHNPHFVTTVAQALSQSELPPERLELEVTESVFLHEGTCATPVLERLLDPRPEGRRVGKECGSTCRYRWSPDLS